MKYLVFAVFTDGHGGDVATHSKSMDLGDELPVNRESRIITSIAESGLGKANLREVFVFKNAKLADEAPEQVAYWNQDDGLFGAGIDVDDGIEEEIDEDDDDSEDTEEETDSEPFPKY